MVIDEGHPPYEVFGGIHRLDANLKAVAGYQSGKFPDGTVIVFDLLEAISADNAVTEGPRKIVGVMYKDAREYAPTAGRGFEGGWRWRQSKSGRGGQRGQRLLCFPRAAEGPRPRIQWPKRLRCRFAGSFDGIRVSGRGLVGYSGAIGAAPPSLISSSNKFGRIDDPRLRTMLDHCSQNNCCESKPDNLKGRLWWQLRATSGRYVRKTLSPERNAPRRPEPTQSGPRHQRTAVVQRSNRAVHLVGETSAMTVPRISALQFCPGKRFRLLVAKTVSSGPSTVKIGP